MADSGSRADARMDPALLDGLRVVEFGYDIAAPLVGMLLAEQGAEVVRVVSPRDTPVDPVGCQKSAEALPQRFQRPPGVGEVPAGSRLLS